MRRELAVCLGAGLVGGGLVLLAAGQPWGDAVGGSPGTPVPAADAVNPVGSLLSSLGAVLLLGAVVVGVTRTTGRRLAGAVIVLGAVAAAYVTVAADDGWSLARVGALLGAVLGLVAGTLAAARGPHWAAMSSRYDAPSARRSAADTDPWRALDRGEDPTL
jgi:hypothetical protein